MRDGEAGESIEGGGVVDLAKEAEEKITAQLNKGKVTANPSDYYTYNPSE
jgi:hypothetical protein